MNAKMISTVGSILFSTFVTSTLSSAQQLPPPSQKPSHLTPNFYCKTTTAEHIFDGHQLSFTFYGYGNRNKLDRKIHEKYTIYGHSDTDPSQNGALLVDHAEVYKNKSTKISFAILRAEDKRTASDIDWSKESDCLKQLEPTYAFTLHVNDQRPSDLPPHNGNDAPQMIFDGELQLLPNFVKNPEVEGCPTPYIKLAPPIQLQCRE